MTSVDRGSTGILWVTDVLDGTLAASPATVERGAVVRIGLALDRPVPAVTSETVVGSGFSERTDPAALVVGPTGLALGAGGWLYVADSDRNRITVIPDALGRSRSARDRDGGDPGRPAERPAGPDARPQRRRVGGERERRQHHREYPRPASRWPTRCSTTTPSPDPGPGNGALFGLAVAPGGHGLYFVDDDQNALDLRS